MFWPVSNTYIRHTHRHHTFYSYLMGLYKYCNYFKITETGFFSDICVFNTDFSLVIPSVRRDFVKEESTVLEYRSDIKHFTPIKSSNVFIGTPPKLYQGVSVENLNFFINFCILEVICYINKRHRTSYVAYGSSENFFIIRDLQKGEVAGWFIGIDSIAGDTVDFFKNVLYTD